MAAFVSSPIHLISHGSRTTASRKLTRNLAIANRSRVSCAHNTSRASIVYPLTLKSRFGVTQGHWKWHHFIDGTRVSKALKIMVTRTLRYNSTVVSSTCSLHWKSAHLLLLSRDQGGQHLPSMKLRSSSMNRWNVVRWDTSYLNSTTYPELSPCGIWDIPTSTAIQQRNSTTQLDRTFYTTSIYTA